MKTTIKLVVMAALCLNFCYGQDKTSKSYIYALTGFKYGYKTGYRFNDDEFKRGRAITVRNYTMPQLFALALRLEHPAGASQKQIDRDQIIIDVLQPEKLIKKYCYKLVVPYNHQDSFYELMQRSLNEEFPEYLIKVEKRDKEYVMIIRDRPY